MKIKIKTNRKSVRELKKKKQQKFLRQTKSKKVILVQRRRSGRRREWVWGRGKEGGRRQRGTKRREREGEKLNRVGPLLLRIPQGEHEKKYYDSSKIKNNLPLSLLEHKTLCKQFLMKIDGGRGEKKVGEKKKGKGVREKAGRIKV